MAEVHWLLHLDDTDACFFQMEGLLRWFSNLSEVCFILFHQIYRIQVASFGFYLVILLVISRWTSRRLKSGPNKDDHLQKCGAFTLFHFLSPPQKTASSAWPHFLTSFFPKLFSRADSTRHHQDLDNKSQSKIKNLTVREPSKKLDVVVLDLDYTSGSFFQWSDMGPPYKYGRKFIRGNWVLLVEFITPFITGTVEAHLADGLIFCFALQ